MAKIKDAITKLSGKVGNEVHVNSKKYGYHTRKPPKISKAQDDNLATNRERVKLLSQLASEINKIIGSYCDPFKSSDFYHSLLTKMFDEPLDNRFLILRQLKDMNVNPDYPFNKLGQCLATTRGNKNRIDVELTIRSHPPEGKYHANCCYYEVILIRWTKKNKKATHIMKTSEWMQLGDDVGVFDFKFRKPKDTIHWLLCLRQRLGIDKKEIESFAAESMQITDTGTLDKNDEKILMKRMAAKEKEKIKARNKVPEKKVVRVKPRRIIG